MQPGGGGGNREPAHADAYEAASSPNYYIFSGEKNRHFKGHFSSLLVQKLYCVFPEAKKRSWPMLDIFIIYIPMSYQNGLDPHVQFTLKYVSQSICF